MRLDEMRRMVVALFCETLRILGYMNFNAPLYDTVLQKHWRDTSIVFKLGINTALSRKLLTSKPDTKKGQTIVINSGQRSSIYELSIHLLRLCPQARIFYTSYPFFV